MSRTGFFDPGAECRLVARRFEEIVRSDTADPGIAPGNVIILLPYALAGARPFPDCLSAARSMAMGNAFGAAHFLQQDRWLDGDESPVPSGARLSDVSFLCFVREYARLFPDSSVFWRHLERYIDEYHASLEWESTVLLSEDGGLAVAEEQLAGTLLKLGRKMSPLKASVVGMALLAGRLDTLARAERMVEEYHAAYQLADDVEDLVSDLAAERWSAAAWLMAVRSGLATPREASGAGELLRLAAGSGALDELAELVSSRYERAAASASAIGASILESHLRQSAERARLVLGRMSRRLTVAERVGGNGEGAGTLQHRERDVRVGTMGATSKGLHDFRVRGETFVYDTRGGLFFEADRLAADVIGWLRAGASDAALEVLRMNHGDGPVGEALEEVGALAGHGRSARPGTTATLEFSMGAAPSPGVEGPSLSGLASVALNVSGGCNLACDYCYLSREPRTSVLMSDEIAKGAVDLLMSESFGERNVSVVFFGGEPLLNPGLIERTTDYARGLAVSRGVDVSFHMTTNGTLLTPDVSEMLAAAGVRVLVSIDGPKSFHDSHRPFADGSGSYSRIVANLERLPEGARPGARATVTEDAPPLKDLVAHLAGLGFGVVHLSPVSGGAMKPEFADRLVRELDELAFAELAALREGRPPRAGCFIEPVLALELGRQRLAPCGAGARYVSVDHDGRLFLCHRFAGDSRYEVGDVVAGLDRFAIGRLLHEHTERSAACLDCWAFGLCGGPCMHDADFSGGSSHGPAGQRCRITRRTLELSMWLYASLPEESRGRLAEAARLAARPEIESPHRPGAVGGVRSQGTNTGEGR